MDTRWNQRARRSIIRSGRLLFLGAALAALPAVPASGSSPLPYFGYYHADMEAYGHYMDKVVIPADRTRLYDYTNLIELDIGHYGQSNPRRAIIDAANLGYRILLYGASGFDPNNPSLWQSGLTEFQSAVHGYEDYVYAVDLVDEPDGWGWSRSQMESLAAQAKTYFKGGMPITMNLDIPEAGQSPRNLDLYTFDYYINYGGATTTRAQYDTGMNNRLAAIRAAAGPGKPILIIGDCFSDTGGFGFPSTAQQQWYYDRAINAPDVTGLMWFMLANAPPSTTGAISSPQSLALHKQQGLANLLPRPDRRLDDRIDAYGTQSDVGAAYSGAAPTLTIAMDHGSNGGKSLKFGVGQEMATRTISAENAPGSAEAFVYDATVGPFDYFGFRAVSKEGKTIGIYARGGYNDYYIDDDGNGVTGLDTNAPSLAHWQKVQFAFDGLGVRVYADSLLVYHASGGWAGGFSQVGFYDRWNSAGSGYIDDLRAYQSAPSGTVVNLGANQNLGSLSLNATQLNVGRDPNGADVLSRATVPGTLRVLGAGASYLTTTLPENTVTSSGTFQIDGNSTLVKQGAGALMVNGAQNHGMGALLIVNGGTVTLDTDAGSTVHRHLMIDANASVRFSATQHLAALRVGPAGTASVDPSGDRLLVAGSLSIASGGRLDLADNDMLLDYTGPSPLDTVRARIRSAFGSGAWDGSGIASSAAMLVPGTALGYGECSVLGSSRFGGEDVDSSAIAVKYTWAGDASLDGKVDVVDLGLLATAWQTSNYWTSGDFDYSKFIDVIDLGVLATNWQRGAANPLGPGIDAALAGLGLPQAGVPEPATAAAMSAAVVLAGRRRRHRQRWRRHRVS